MKSFIRRHVRGCLIATGLLLTLAFGLQESMAQFGRPQPPSGSRPPSGGIGGGFEYRCSRCNTRVTATAQICPGCGARFVGTTYTPGIGRNTGGSGPSMPPSTPPSIPPQGGYVPPSTPPAMPPQGGYVPPYTPPSSPPNTGIPPQGGGSTPPQGGYTPPPQGGGYTPPRQPSTSNPMTPQPPSIPTGNTPPSAGDTSTGTPTPANNTSTSSSNSSSSDADSGNTVRMVLGVGIGVLGLGAIVGAAFLFLGNNDRPRRPVRRVRPRLD